MFGNNAPSYPTPAGRSPSIETGTKLYISNLEYGVSNEDIKVWFLILLNLVFQLFISIFIYVLEVLNIL